MFADSLTIFADIEFAHASRNVMILRNIKVHMKLFIESLILIK